MSLFTRGRCVDFDAHDDDSHENSVQYMRVDSDDSSSSTSITAAIDDDDDDDDENSEFQIDVSTIHTNTTNRYT